MIFLIFPSFFLLLSVGAYEKTVECDLYNQRYPNLTITKVMGEKTTTICDDICVNYLCAVNFDDPNENKRIYAMGSGCREDVVKNCEFYIDFGVEPHNYLNTSILASVCVNETGRFACALFSLSRMIYYAKHQFPNKKVGWDHVYDIQWESDVVGVSTWNESLNTIYPVTVATSTPLPIDTSTTSSPFITETPEPDTPTSSAVPSFIFSVLKLFFLLLLN